MIIISQDFVLILSDSVAPIRTLRVKSNAKRWFDNGIVNAIWNRDKHFKIFKLSGKEIGNGNFKCAMVLRVQ